MMHIRSQKNLEILQVYDADLQSHIDIITGQTLTSPPTPSRSGILADELRAASQPLGQLLELCTLADWSAAGALASH